MDESNPLQQALRNRTKKFAVEIIRLTREASNDQTSRVITNQLLRAATSVAANYRSCGRARSHRDFVSRMSIVLEEADETFFWIELLLEIGTFSSKRIEPLLKEAGELVLIFSASQATATKRRRSPGRRLDPPIVRSSD